MKAMPSCLTLGNFDGVHLGHQALIRVLLERANVENAQAKLLTFHPHPMSVLRGRESPLLMSLRDRQKAIQALGDVDVEILEFTAAFSQVSYQDFLQSVLHAHEVVYLVVGPTTQVGRGGQGTPDRLAMSCKQIGVSFDVLPPYEVEGEIVSSSRIRQLLLQGDVARAADLLGRPHLQWARVEKGDGRGRGLGFPTLNLGELETMLPASGVYAARVKMGGAWLGAAINVGRRPTFYETGQLTVEAHILEPFDVEVRVEAVGIAWLERLRAETKFPDVQALQSQIQADVQAAKKVISKGKFIEELKKW